MLPFFVLAALGAQARPVSYPGGWTVMQMNDADSYSAHVHYSPTAKYSVGFKSQYWRDNDWWFNGLQVNYLVNRWNAPKSQANLYLKGGVGDAYSDAGVFDGEHEVAGFVGLAADWENRHYFASYENQYVEAGKIDDFFS